MPERFCVRMDDYAKKKAAGSEPDRQKRIIHKILWDSEFDPVSRGSQPQSVSRSAPLVRARPRRLMQTWQKATGYVRTVRDVMYIRYV